MPANPDDSRASDPHSNGADSNDARSNGADSNDAHSNGAHSDGAHSDGAHSDDPPANDSPLADTATRFLLAGARWHVLFVGLATVAALILGDPRLAAGLALGALLMYANLTMATRTLKRTFRGTGSVPQSPSAALAWATRWPLLALALVGILWYMPARPEGIALGVGLSLLSSVLAALGLTNADPNHG